MRKSKTCSHCNNPKARYSRLTNIYWCHNCNTRLKFKREIEIIEKKDILVPIIKLINEGKRTSEQTNVRIKHL